MSRLFLIFVTGLHCVATLNVPPDNNCSKYFQYIEEGGEYFGKITLHKYELKKQAISIDFSYEQLEPLTNFVGDLVTFEDLLATEQSLIDGKPISYRVTFPSKLELPKVIGIKVNDVEICSGISHNDHYMGTLSHGFTSPNVLDTDTEIQPLWKNQYSEEYKAPDKAPETNKATTTTSTTAATTTTTTRTRSATIKLKPIINVDDSRNFDRNLKCGRSMDTSATPLIYGGANVRRGQFPWLVPIFRKEGTTLDFICGGSLISKSTVITAGHCFKLRSLRAENVMVFVGRHDIFNFVDRGTEPREIEKLVIHPDYEKNNIADADLALMHLMEPVNFNQFIKPICLWNEPVDDDRTMDIIDQSGVVAGWGENEKGHVLQQPQMVNTKIVSDIVCLRSAYLFKAMTSNRTICAGYRNDTGPCKGDSGSGLMMQRDGIWMLRGIVSVGVYKFHKCDLREFVVYCDLAKHSAWVKDNMLN